MEILIWPENRAQPCATEQHLFTIGIDTGGTYTDAVMLHSPSGQVLQAVKVPTTSHNPAIGIGSALQAVMAADSIEPGQVDLVTVSTTLATNALVENKGAEVGLFIIGHDKRMDMPVADFRYIPGGHRAKGIEEEPLGMEYVVQGITEMRAHVDAWAVCAMMAFEDPTHELVTAKALSLMDPGRPVFCSHQASTRPGMRERAATAVLNARLLPVMRSFLDSIASSMQQLGLTCPVRIVRGDCLSMNLDEALRNSSATVASGPAATALFGAQTANGQTALVVDVGGTTTDIALIRKGRPVIREDGMTVGPWRTHVRAVEMFTAGIGGDSLVRVSNGLIELGPARVLPLCQAGLHVAGEHLQRLTRADWLGAALNCQCVVPAPDAQPGGDPILEWLVTHGPATAAELREHLRLAEASLEKAITRLFATQKIFSCGFTPTDALHVLGRLELGDREASLRGAQRLAELLGLDAEAFSRQVLEQAHRGIAGTILTALGNREVGPALTGFLQQDQDDALLEISVRVRPQLIGIGAAAPYLLPAVAEKLGTTVIFPERFDVGNAVGAAIMPLSGSHYDKE